MTEHDLKNGIYKSLQASVIGQLETILSLMAIFYSTAILIDNVPGIIYPGYALLPFYLFVPGYALIRALSLGTGIFGKLLLSVGLSLTLLVTLRAIVLNNQALAIDVPLILSLFSIIALTIGLKFGGRRTPVLET